VQANLDKHLQFIEQAEAQGVELVVFPELSLTGYMLQDWYTKWPARQRPTIRS